MTGPGKYENLLKLRGPRITQSYEEKPSHHAVESATAAETIIEVNAAESVFWLSKILDRYLKPVQQLHLRLT